MFLNNIFNIFQNVFIRIMGRNLVRSPLLYKPG